MTHYKGLDLAEVQKRQQEFGPNALAKKKGVPFWRQLLGQFNSFLIYLLLGAALLAIGLGEWIDGVFIIVIVLLNGLLGMYQERKAEKAIEALQKMTVAKVRVIREGQEVAVASTELVPGDVVVLEEGSKVPADGVVLEAFNMEANESALTGESVAVGKEVLGKDEEVVRDAQKVFMGTTITRGRGVVEIRETGMQSVFGKISQTLASIEKAETPLTVQLSNLGKMLGVAAIIACTLVMGLGLLRAYMVENVSGERLMGLFLTAISLAVAAVPEGLPAVLTITLAMGMHQMTKRKAVVRKLSAIETLGQVNVICTDKTGTLTTNQMRVRELWSRQTELTLKNNEKVGEEALPGWSDLVKIGVVCSTATLSQVGGRKEVLGDGTEGALLFLAEDFGVDYVKMREEGELVKEFGFDSIRKLMSVVVHYEGQLWVYTKGSPESVLRISTVSDEEKRRIEVQVEAYAKQGLRVMGFARKVVAGVPQDLEEAESGLEFVGLVGIADPPRKEVGEAIGLAHKAGVRTVMVTGDNVITAGAIGREVGIVSERVLDGQALKGMSDEELKEALKTVSIFARVAPEDKLRVVRLFEEQGAVVAVTGDGVNDALALKQANIGLAMGITGTDVSKETADIVLMDDNYATIVAAIEEGRRIYRNIVKAVHYLVSTNLSEIFLISGSVFFLDHEAQPLTPKMLLWLNLVTDGLPALVLATDTVERGMMKEPPRGRERQIIEGRDWLLLGGVGLLIAAITGWVFWLGLMMGGVYVGRTWAFVTIVALQLVRVLVVRRSWPFNNPHIVIVLGVSLLLQVGVVIFEPTRRLFDLMP